MAFWLNMVINTDVSMMRVIALPLKESNTIARSKFFNSSKLAQRLTRASLELVQGVFF